MQYTKDDLRNALTALDIAASRAYLEINHMRTEYHGNRSELISIHSRVEALIYETSALLESLDEKEAAAS